jgi:hypothetical protein
MLSKSHRAPGYLFQYHTPPGPSAASKHCTVSPCTFRSRWVAYRPEKPAPTITASTSLLVMQQRCFDVTLRTSA